MRSDLHKELQSIGRKYALNKTYWVAEEVPTTCGVCDVWGISRSLDYATIAIEVKVSKQDYRSQSQKDKERYTVNNPMGNTNYVLCPSGLIRSEEIHELWGLLWWNGERIVNKKPAQFVECDDKHKLMTLINFLNNGNNTHKPILDILYVDCNIRNDKRS